MGARSPGVQGWTIQAALATTSCVTTSLGDGQERGPVAPEEMIQLAQISQPGLWSAWQQGACRPAAQSRVQDWSPKACTGLPAASPVLSSPHVDGFAHVINISVCLHMPVFVEALATAS